MPGIAGLITSKKQNIKPIVEQMRQEMVHEIDQTSGAICIESLGMGVAWVCHAGSYSDCQPVWSNDHTVGLAFAGEHFAEKESKSISGLNDSSPAETAADLANAYQLLGVQLIKQLNGCFSGAFWDSRQGNVVLFNDRYGLGRIYWHQNADGFYFASEAKAILRVLPKLRRLDTKGWAELLQLGGPLQNRSIFEGISLLPGGSLWTFPLGADVKKSKYFNYSSWENQLLLDSNQYYNRLKENFSRILPRYFQGPQKLALSLTGGLDTRMILANSASEPGTLPCYTFGGMLRESQDVIISRRIAAQCRQPFQVITLGDNFFQKFPALAARSVFLTDGAFDVTGAVGLFTNHEARAIAPIRLTGNYGSEILRGNLVFKPHFVEESLFHQDFHDSLRAALATYQEERQVPRTTFIAFKQVPWHHFGRLALEQSQLTLRSPYLDNDLVALAFQAPLDIEVNRALTCRFIAECNPSLARIPTDFGYLGSGGAYRRLRIACQWFIHRTDYIFDYGMPHWLVGVDRVLRLLRWERLFLGRHKYAHFRIWYRKQLAPFVKEVLLDPQTLGRPYLNRNEIEKMVLAHTRGYGNHTLEIHKLLTTEMIERHLISMS